MICTALDESELASKKGELKDVNFEIPEFTEPIITPSPLTSTNPNMPYYSVNSIVYWHTKKCYARIIKHDSETNEYLLKLRSENKLSDNDELVPSYEISTNIAVTIQHAKHDESSATDSVKHKKSIRVLDINQPVET